MRYTFSEEICRKTRLVGWVQYCELGLAQGKEKRPAVYGSTSYVQPWKLGFSVGRELLEKKTVEKPSRTVGLGRVLAS